MAVLESPSESGTVFGTYAGASLGATHRDAGRHSVVRNVLPGTATREEESVRRDQAHSRFGSDLGYLVRLAA